CVPVSDVSEPRREGLSGPDHRGDPAEPVAPRPGIAEGDPGTTETSKPSTTTTTETIRRCTFAIAPTRIDPFSAPRGALSMAHPCQLAAVRVTPSATPYPP